MSLQGSSRDLPESWGRRNLLAVNIAAALVYAGFTFIMPFLPIYVRELGVAEDANVASWSGLLITISPLLAALLGPAWGRLGDRYGLKIMVERCTLVMAVHWGLFSLAQNVYHLLALRILLGMLGGFATLSMPLLVASAPKAQMGRSIGTLQTIQMIASAAGPLIGGFLADWIGIRSTCLVTAAFASAALVLIHWLYHEPVRGHVAAGSLGAPSFKQAVTLPSFGIIVVVLFFVGFIERSFAPIVPLFIRTLGTGAGSVARTAGIIISLGMLAEGVSSYALGHRLKTRPARSILLRRLAAGALVCLGMGLVWTTAQLLWLRLALGLLAGGGAVVVYTLASRIIPPETRATSFSVLASVALLGTATGPIIAGALAHWSLRTIFFFNSAVFLFLMVLSAASLREPRSAGGQ